MLHQAIGEQIVFSPFHLDLRAGRLSRDGHPLELPPKAFSVLRYLAERPEQLVSKDELLGAIWPDVFVGDSVLKVTISELRRVLDDAVRQPKYIETAHRRGYRFVAKTTHQPSVAAPKTSYARSGDLNIAYQVMGDGPVDLVFVMGWVSHLDFFWTEPSFARFLRQMAGFSRLILFDKRGTGLSDRVPVDALPTLEQRMDDVRAVMDAAGSKRAVICGVSEGGAMSALFAATYPERAAGLIMIGSYARRMRDASYPWGPTDVQRREFIRYIRDHWGEPVGLEERAPSVSKDPEFREWWAGYLRNAASPSAAVALTQMNSEADIREVLPSIRVPTLVIHRTGDRCLAIEEGRFLASRIPGAQMLELPGDDHLPFVGDQDSILGPIEEFLRNTPETQTDDTVLATIATAEFEYPADCSGLGNARQKLHDHIARELAWHRGRDFESAPGSLAAFFDGPGRAVRCMCAIAHHASILGVSIRAGLHVGECVVRSGSVTGPVVDTARSVLGSARPGEILVSSTVRDLVSGSSLAFARRPAQCAVPVLKVTESLPKVKTFGAGKPYSEVA